MYQALEEQWVVTIEDCEFYIIQCLSTILGKAKWKNTVALEEGNHIIAIWSEFIRDIYEVAVDLGSTTITAHLCDFNNSQVVTTAGIMYLQISLWRRLNESRFLLYGKCER